MTILVKRAPAYLTVQDLGRSGARALGVPAGGAMDVVAARVGNALVGNPAHAASLEWALGGGSVCFESEHVIALTGASCETTLGSRAIGNYAAIHVRRDDELEVGRIGPGRFLYLSVCGGIDVPLLIGSRSTYLPGRFGGLEGRLLRTGDRLPIAPHKSSTGNNSSKNSTDVSRALSAMAEYSRSTIRLTRGTHSDMFPDSAWTTLLESEYTISPASDRTGYRLDGPAVPGGPVSLPSEAGCPGVVQIPGDGKPIVLMADAPTVGGYPKIAVVSQVDLPALSQRSPGEPVRFELVSIEESQRLLRRRLDALNEIESMAAVHFPYC